MSAAGQHRGDGENNASRLAQRRFMRPILSSPERPVPRTVVDGEYLT